MKYLQARNVKGIVKCVLMAVATAFAYRCLAGEAPRDVRVAAYNAPAAQRAAAARTLTMRLPRTSRIFSTEQR